MTEEEKQRKLAEAQSTLTVLGQGIAGCFNFASAVREEVRQLTILPEWLVTDRVLVGQACRALSEVHTSILTSEIRLAALWTKTKRAADKLEDEVRQGLEAAEEERTGRFVAPGSVLTMRRDG